MDTIKGKVTNVIDGDTFDMTVTHIGKNNEFEYGNSENVRISEFDAPELDTNQGKIDKVKLEKLLLNKVVRVYVDARDTYGRVVGRVEIVE